MVVPNIFKNFFRFSRVGVFQELKDNKHFGKCVQPLTGSVFDYSDLRILLLRTSLLPYSPSSTCSLISSPFELHPAHSSPFFSRANVSVVAHFFVPQVEIVWGQRLHGNSFTLIRSLNFFIFLWADFQLAGDTIRSSKTAKSEALVVAVRLPEPRTDSCVIDSCE